MPYAREDRVLNFSRFDIDGAQNLSAEDLDAFIFTERGVYRPGDEIHAGLVVKQRNWSGQLAGLPIETEVLDARDLPVRTKKVTLPETGFLELSYQTSNDSPTGAYQINAYLIKNNKRSTLLGSTVANVKEFLPDRMKIETRLSQETAHGWIRPKQMRASILLANLYGTPATDRRITAKLDLSPAGFNFPEFRDFIFCDPTFEEKKERRPQSVELGDKKTDNDHPEKRVGFGFAIRDWRKSGRRLELHCNKQTARARFHRGRSAAQAHCGRKCHAQSHRPGICLRAVASRQRKLRLPFGAERAARAFGETRHFGEWFALRAPYLRTRQLRD
ncbi:MAG: hypothetical protein DMF19_06575 [Verrucomicrobia bacterium]|nr:MAG: hypothetical protein DMF19_06575 [Verrucomicrobiota bacterium]